MNSRSIAVILTAILMLYTPTSALGNTNDSMSGHTNYTLTEAKYVPQFGFSFEEIIIANSSDYLSNPTDLEFHPGRTSELWIANRATDSITIVHNTDLDNQTSETRLDVNRNHFLEEVSAISFGSYHPEFDWQWGSAQESLNTYNGQGDPNYFMGPALWPSSLDHFAEENQNNEGGLLGSHIDMLHESPYGVGIAHDYDNVYWYNDGYYGELVRYDFMMDHDTGGHDHSDGKVHRYSEIQLNHLYGTPSHMILDKDTDILYISDAGANRIIWVNTNDSTYQSEDIMNDSSRLEPLSEYTRISGVEWGVLVEGVNTPSGIALYKTPNSSESQLFISLNGDSSIISYALNSDGKNAEELGSINTSASSIMGIEIGPNGNLYYVDSDKNEVVKVEPVLDEDSDGYGNIDQNIWFNSGLINWKDKFPNNPLEWLDSDTDGIGNNADLDDDNDGWSDLDEINCSFEENTYHTENPLSMPRDIDSDGICDFIDGDDDDDGWSDIDEEKCTLASESLYDIEDVLSYPEDTDNDGNCNELDLDDDGDGWLDEADNFPLNPNEWVDNDNDGIGNNEDLDDDNDMISDISESENGTDPFNEDTDFDGYTDLNDIFPLEFKEWIDSDNDGIGDNADSFPSISRYQSSSDLVLDLLIIFISLGLILTGRYAVSKRK